MKKAFFIYTADNEDGGSMGFKCALEIPKDTVTYEEAVNYLRPILSSEEFVKALIEEDYLEDELFQGYKFKFVSCDYRRRNLEYEFEYSGDEELNGEVDSTQIFIKNMDIISMW